MPEWNITVQFMCHWQINANYRDKRREEKSMSYNTHLENKT